MSELFRTEFSVGEHVPQRVNITPMFIFPELRGAAIRLPKGYLTNRTEVLLYDYSDYLWARKTRYTRMREQKAWREHEKEMKYK